MAILAVWNGAGLTDGATLTTTLAGPGDTPFALRNGTVQTIERIGAADHSDIVFAQAAGAASWIGWGQAVFGTTGLAQYTLRWYGTFTAWASASFTAATGLTGNNTTQQWRLTLAGTGAGTQAGQLRILTGTGTQLATSGSDVLPLNEPVRIEIGSDAGALTVRAYPGDATVPLATATATGLPSSGFDTVRFGPNSSTPTTPQFRYRHFAASDTAAPIGPVVPPPDAAWTVWDGAAEQPLTLEGVWDGAAIIPATYDTVT
ncbi:hypothetical protein SAMN05421505_12076 [Sinosporangium album]|uniref:Uncharacterized protein n=1 Tax=Sinosporangium album TaxID=504805 RepID=A0A1G8EFE7_9ACTN|nr:hypothetical protein [Sinosporangium album]SDH68604.1 hypothetical protein SAMN05421505_12076 [Sinosporangium album]